jgi:hypothetical protein
MALPFISGYPILHLSSLPLKRSLDQRNGVRLFSQLSERTLGVDIHCYSFPNRLFWKLICQEVFDSLIHDQGVIRHNTGGQVLGRELGSNGPQGRRRAKGVTRGAAFIRLSRHSSVPQLKVRDLRLASNILLVPKALSEYTINNT